MSAGFRALFSAEAAFWKTPLLFAAMSAVLLAGCKARIPDGVLACDEPHPCPSGYDCHDGFCYSSPPDDPDAGGAGQSGSDAASGGRGGTGGTAGGTGGARGTADASDTVGSGGFPQDGPRQDAGEDAGEDAAICDGGCPPDASSDRCNPDPCHERGVCDPVDGACTCENEYMTDDCSACESGYTGYPDCDCDAADKDCAGECFGDSITDASGECCSLSDMDCLDKCFGMAVYDCGGKVCGPDGCGGYCSPGCTGGKTCNASGSCIRTPSCAVDQPGADSSCGPGGDEDCCSSPLVTGGTYYRTYDAYDFWDDNYPATVSDFRLDRFEVTVGRFRAFVEAGKGTRADPPQVGAGAHPFNPGSGWDTSYNTYLAADTSALSNALMCNSIWRTWTPTPGAHEHLPTSCVTWYEAFAFCAWDGGWLPTEAEWNYAAAGGAEQRHYPWSSPATDTTIDGTYAVYDCMGDDSASDECDFSDILSVGSRSPKGDGLWGQADLGGSIWEWNLDWYNDYVNPCNNCTDLLVSRYRIIRGGTSYSDAYQLRAAYRKQQLPKARIGGTGLRCARIP